MNKIHKPKPVETNPDFPKLERESLEYWYRSGIVKKYLSKNKDSKKYFSFLDGPITANNPMGVHHAWGRTYKDLWQRYHNLLGEKQRFQSGFDAQGLWVEVEVEKELGFKSKKDIESYGVERFVDECKKRVRKFAKIQTEQSKRLGYFMDWDHSYITMSDANNYMIWHFISLCHQNGWLYKGNESVPWCPRCETAISQHEMLTEDYKEVTHESIYLELPLLGKKNEFLLVWTTTPWTIPGNISVAVDEKLDYALVKGKSGDSYWVAKETVNRVFSSDHQIIKTIKGKNLLGLKYQAPYDYLPAVDKISKHPRFHTVIPSDPRILPVSTEEGTGLVHTAVSAGTEDFKLGKKLDLPMVPLIADNADYLEGLGELTGKNAKQDPRIILDYLENEDKKPNVDWVFSIENYTHRYPACWRCKQELVWKVTEEWYIAMDRGKPSLRQRMQRVAKKINWLPSFGLERELDWLNNMHDWLISKKNRYWGLCLPIWECHKCKNFIVIGSKQELEKKAVEGWEEFKGKSPHKPHIDKIRLICPNCNELISRIEPVGNPWLDAGIVPFSTIMKNNLGEPLYLKDKKTWEKWYPADFITESFPGQFKNWFYSLIAMSTVLEDQNPFKTVLGFGTLLGEDGRPMHKSWGNAIEFNEGADKIGVDVMRWLYAKHDPSQNLLFGENKANLVRRQFHLILWNSYRFVVNTYGECGTTPKLNYSPYILDRWIISRLQGTLETVTNGLDNFNANLAADSIEQFVQDFSTWYIRRSRDRVGMLAAKHEREEFISTSMVVFDVLMRILAPFTPFLADQMFTNLTGKTSVHLEDWPKTDIKKRDKKLEMNMDVVRQIVEIAHAERKRLQIKVRQPLRLLTVTGVPTSLSKELQNLICDELNVKQVKLIKKGKDIAVKLDTNLTPELIEEGKARDVIRMIQDQRKSMKLTPNDKIDVVLPEIPHQFIELVKSKTATRHIQTGSVLKVTLVKK